MLIYELLPEIKYYVERGYEVDFSERLNIAKSELLIKLTYILEKKESDIKIIEDLKEDRRFWQITKSSCELIKLISSSEGINVLSATNVGFLLIITSTLAILNFYVRQNISVFEAQMTIVKNCIFNCKQELPMFNDFVCSKFNSIFSNLAKLEDTIAQAYNKIMAENFDMQRKQQCIKDFMRHIERPLKELYDGVIDCLVEKQESIVRDVTLLIKHINDYFKWFIAKVKETVRYFIERYNGIAAEQAQNSQDTSMEIDLESSDEVEGSCNVFAAWLAAKWELWFYNSKQQESRQQTDVHPLKGNSFNDIIRQRAASRHSVPI